MEKDLQIFFVSCFFEFLLVFLSNFKNFCEVSYQFFCIFTPSLILSLKDILSERYVCDGWTIDN